MIEQVMREFTPADFAEEDASSVGVGSGGLDARIDFARADFAEMQMRRQGGGPGDGWCIACVFISRLWFLKIRAR